MPSLHRTRDPHGTLRVLALVLLLAAAPLLAGCFGDNTGDDGRSTPTAQFAANWRNGSYAFFLTLSGTTLPSDLRVVVTEIATGRNHTTNAPQLTKRVGETYDIPHGMALTPGGRYRIEAFSGTRSLGHRELTALSEAPSERFDTNARGAFTFLLTVKNTSSGNESDLHITGVANVDATPANTTFTVTGRGVANFTERAAGMTMRLNITDFRMTDTNGVTTAGVMNGEGRWNTESGDGIGGGTLTLKQEVLGEERKADRAGVVHPSRAERLTLHMVGTINTGDADVDLTVHNVSKTWTRLDTDETFWLQSTETVTYTVEGEGEPETTTYDGPAPREESAGPDVFDATTFTGLHPSPLQAGDTFELDGPDGIKVQYAVTDAGTRQTVGRSFAVLEVKGTATAGATGGETVIIIRDGPLAGFPVSMRQRFERGQETLVTEMDLTSLT